MEGQFYFMGIAGLAVSLAGFAWLVSAFRQRSEAWSEVELCRLRTISVTAMLCALFALLPVPFFTLTEDLILTTRAVSGLLVLYHLGTLWRVAHRDPRVWPSLANVRAHYAMQGFLGLLQLANVFWGNLGVLELGMVGLLSYPAGIFVRTVGDFRPGSSPPQ